MLTHLDLLEQYGAILVDICRSWSQVPDSEAMVADSACKGGYLRLVGKQRSRHSVVGSNQIPHRFCQNCKKYQSRRSTMIYPQDVILFGRITFNWRVRGNAWQCIAKLPRSIRRWDMVGLELCVPFLSGYRSMLCSLCSEDLDIMELNQWMHASG